MVGEVLKTVEKNVQPTQGASLFPLFTEGAHIILDKPGVFYMTSEKKLISGALTFS